MLNNLSLIISIVVAIAAISSPIATAIINNRYQLKLRTLELEHNAHEQTTLYVRNIFENYLRGLSLIAHGEGAVDISVYAEYYPLAFMYVPKDLRSEMSQVNNQIHSDIVSLQSVDTLASHIYQVLQDL